jgi:hypothetical protein
VILIFKCKSDRNNLWRDGRSLLSTNIRKKELAIMYILNGVVKNCTLGSTQTFKNRSKGEV